MDTLAVLYFNSVLRRELRGVRTEDDTAKIREVVDGFSNRLHDGRHRFKVQRRPERLETSRFKLLLI